MLFFQLVRYLEDNGIGLAVEEGRLRVSGGQALLTADVVASLKEHKEALLALYGSAIFDAPPRVPEASEAPLSFAQRRMYFLYQYDPQATHFILPVELELRGALDAPCFIHALERVVARHRIYRTTYFVRDGVAWQRIREDIPFGVEYIDLAARGPGGIEAELDCARDRVMRRPFDLANELPVRASLLRYGDGLHVFLLGFHHIATDDWSIRQFVGEVADVYRTLRGGAAPSAAHVPAPSYLDYAHWQVRRFESGALEPARSYWHHALKGAKGILELPLDRARPAVQGYRGQRLERRIPATLREGVSAFARDSRISEYACYLGAYALLLCRLTGEQDLIIGTDVFGRDHAGTEDTAGFFVNQLALRCKVNDGQSIQACLRNVHETVIEAFDYQDMPFDQVVDDLGIERDPAFPPVFQVKFLYEREPRAIEGFEGLALQERAGDAVLSQYDLTLKIVGDRVEAWFNHDLFHTQTVNEWLDLYICLLEESTEQPGLEIELALGSALARNLEPLVQGDLVEVDAARLFDGLDHHAARTPDAVAVRSPVDELSYGQLQALVGRIASRLSRMGMRSGDRVGLYLERSIEMVAAVVAVLRMGGVLVPLDPSYPAEHIEHTLSDSGIAIVVTRSELAEYLPEFFGLTLDVDTVGDHDTVQADYPRIDADAPAYLLYTSGSTGRPKGVFISHRAFANLCDWYVRFAGLEAASRVLLMIPIGFDASLKNIVAPLIVGGTLVLAPAEGFDPRGLLEQMAAAGVSVINCAPSAAYALLREAAADGFAAMRDMRMLALGGEALDRAQLVPWLSSEACNSRVANIYGPTECADISVAFQADKAGWLALPQVVIGRPLQNTRAYVLDERLRLCPRGVVGELVMAGDGVGLGYHQRPELNAQNFIELPVLGGRGYRTGDYCRYDIDGNLVYLGRRDGQIKIRGKRVEVGEIVHQMAQIFPARNVSIQLFAEGGAELLLAFVDGGPSPTPHEQLKDALWQRLPRHMVPAHIVFVEAMPLTPNGKVCRKSLLAHFELHRQTALQAHLELNEVQQQVAQVWQRLLHAQVSSLDDDFFSLGGDSILSIQAVAELRDAGFDVSVADLFKYPSLGRLAQHLSQTARLVTEPHAVASVAPFALVPEIDRTLLPDGLEDAYPVTPLQMGMLFHGLLDDGGSSYHDVFSFELGLAYDEAAFGAAIDRVVALQPALRTGFDLGSYSVPLQLVHASVPAWVEREDIRASALDEQLAYIDDTIARIKATPFALHGPTLIRFTILRRGDDRIQCIVDAHHAILDGWSMATVQRQILECYREIRERVAPAEVFDTGGLRFADYVASVLDDERNAASSAWWDGFVGSLPRLAPLHPIGGNEERFRRRHKAIPAPLARDLENLAARTGVPLKMLLLMAHAQVLRAVTGNSDVLTGMTDHGRPEARGGQNMVGLFLNVTPVFVPGGGSWRSLAAGLRQAEAEAKPHRRYPLASLLQRHPDLAVQANFTYTNFRVATELMKVDWLDVTMGEQFEEVNFPLSIHVSGNPVDGLLVTLNSRICPSEGFMDLLFGRFMGAIQAMVADFDAPVSTPVAGELPWLPQDQWQQVVHEFNASAVDVPDGCLLHQAFEAQVRRDGDATAVEFEGATLSYAALNARANRLAHHLIALGVRPDDRVALCVERGLDMVVALLGVLKAGGAYVPLDPTHPRERLAYLLADSAPRCVLGQASIRGVLPEGNAPVVWLDEIDLASKSDHDPDAVALGLTTRHLAYVIFTSGSTGQPKGVMIEHGSVINLWQALESAIHAGTAAGARVSVNAAISFDASVKMWVQLLSGACLVLVPQQVRFDGRALLQWIRRARIDVFDCTPMQLQMLIDEGLLQSEGHAPRSVLVGGDAIAPAMWRRLGGNARTRIFNVYGPTECTVDATATLIEASEPTPNIGRPLANTRVYIVDAALRPVPVGIAGEILIGGVQVARGYLNRAALTAERFIDDPVVRGGGKVYRTGDLGRWRADGTIEYMGRNDFQVKLRGFRIELGEIETALSRCDGVREAVVLAREDVPGDKRLVAYIVANEGSVLNVQSLRESLSRVLADYMVPSAFVLLQKLPLTHNGKLDRSALPEPGLDALATRAYTAPEGEMEQALASIWAGLLGVERIGRHDHFFELGGHSLLAVQMTARLRAAHGIELSLRDLFARPVLADLAAVLTSVGDALAPILPVDRDQPLALSLAQQRLWFLDQLDHAAGAAYHMPAALILRGHLDRGALRRALDTIVARHEVLRTCFVLAGGMPVQVIGPEDGGFTLLEHDLQAGDADTRATAIAQWTAREATAAFDLSKGPLIRGHLLRLQADEHLLLITQHHIVSDGWSIGLLARELMALYAAFREAQADPLPRLALQYADYAAWQRAQLRGEALESQIGFWRSYLEGAPALLELPTDRPRPSVQSYAGASLPVVLPTSLKEGLQCLSQQHGTTMFMTLLAAWSVLLARLSGQESVVIGTPVANRPRPELESLIGFFVNTLALRIDVEDGERVADLLTRVRGLALDAYAHQDLPFDQVVEAVKPPRSLAHNAIFQNMLAFNNTPAVALEVPGLALSEVTLPHNTTHFDLSLSLSDTAEGLAGVVEYASDLFDAATIERWMGYYRSLLEAMVGDPGRSVYALPMLPANERAQVLHAFNATAQECDDQAMVHRLFEAQAARTPQAVAAEHLGNRLSYGDLNHLANRVAHALLARGLAPDDRVAICVDRSFDMLVSLLGVLKAGAAYVPLDAAYPAGRLAFMLADCSPALILTQRHLVSNLPATSVPVLCIDEAEAWMASSTDNPEPTALGLTGKHLAYVIYTSGSTGQPKGVMVEHESFAHYVQWAQTAYGRGQGGLSSLVSSALAFDATITSLYVPLVDGGRVVLLEQGQELPELEARLREPRTWGLVKLTPTHLQWLGLRFEPSARAGRGDVFVVGGETLPTQTAARWQAISPQARLINEYGPTETVVGCVMHEIEGPVDGHDVPIGRPIANTRIFIVDRGDQPVPVGVAGEILIGGAGVARGYLGRAELTAQRFIDDPFSAGGGKVYRTGDLARWRADGVIEYLGRSDFQVKLRGFRIELGEIEAALLHCPGVREAVVLAREDSPGHKRLVAYVVASEGMSPNAAMLREALSHSLAEYMMPSAFVLLPELPLTPNGKLDRRALPAPGLDALAVRAYVAPEGEMEQALADIWTELLAVERVGRHDHFFELGGHSLLAMQVVMRIRDRLGVDIALADLFRHPVLSALCDHVLMAMFSVSSEHDVARLEDELQEIGGTCVSTAIDEAHSP